MYSIKCRLRFVITLKANQKCFTLVALFNIRALISTKIALHRLVETLIIKISFNFTFSADYGSVVIQKKLFTNFNVFFCLDIALVMSS